MNLSQDGKIHICFISQEFPPETGWGGIGAYTYDLARGLSDLGQRVSVISLADGDGEKEVVADGVHIYRIQPKPNWARWPGLWRLNHLWPGFAWAARQKVMELHKSFPIDIIESPENRADSYLIKPFCPEPCYVVRLHTASQFVDEMNRKRPNLRWRFTYRQEKWVLRHADWITAPSQAVVNLTEKAYRLPKKLSIIPNPIDSEHFHPGSAKKEAELLFVGRLEAHKGVELLCKLIPRLLESIPSLRVRMAGHDTLNHRGESWKSMLLSAVKPEDQNTRLVISPVDRQKLPAHYRRASVVCVPSLWENFPYVVLESMSCGTPVVASRVGGIPSMVDHGRTGFLVVPNDLQMFEHYLRLLLLDLDQARELGCYARQSVEKKYSIHVVAPLMLNFYQGLL